MNFLSRWFVLWLIVGDIAILNMAFGVEPAAGLPLLMELQLGSRLERGLPIAWHPRGVMLLQTNGSIVKFDPDEIRQHQILDQPFQPETAIHLRGKLQQEFGSRYAVDGSGDFAIVAPHASIQIWTQRFAQLERSFENYFRTRGFALRRAEFPLIGIVFQSQADFLRYANQVGIALQPRTLGYYSGLTNRLYLYESDHGSELDGQTLATVWHEAAHQLAFNRGLHQRLSSPPLWMMEGLASIFEAPGMMAQRSTMNPSELINETRWGTWKRLSMNSEAIVRHFEAMIRDDRLFQTDPDAAYAIAWGVSLYLAERDTNHYVAYLRTLSQLQPGEEYRDENRIQDFERTFKTRPTLLIKAADRFLQSL